MRKQEMIARFIDTATANSASPKLEDGSRVAVMGAGPAGSFFATFLLDMAERVDMKLQVDLYEPRDFSRSGPAGCNMGAGIISESLVQHLAAEGITLPPSVVKVGIDSYVLHMDVGNVPISSFVQEKRIASVYRGAGPLSSTPQVAIGFDAFCLSLATRKGARLVPRRIEKVSRTSSGFIISTRSGSPEEYDLLAVATGVNTNAFRLFPSLEPSFQAPETVRTLVREYRLGREIIEQYLGSSFHVFLLDLPGLDFAAIVPKGEYATLCLLGNDVSDESIATLLDSAQVRQCMPPHWEPGKFVCGCAPRMQITEATRLYADRLVFIGDSGVSRLYKDGFGAAYRTAKAAASTAVFYGISQDDFQNHFWPVCQTIIRDNKIGKFIFTVTRQIQHHRLLRLTLLRMIAAEQGQAAGRRRASTILWDTFTGSAPYRDILLRSLHPAYIGAFVSWLVACVLWDGEQQRKTKRQRFSQVVR